MTVSAAGLTKSKGASFAAEAYCNNDSPVAFRGKTGYPRGVVTEGKRPKRPDSTEVDMARLEADFPALSGQAFAAAAQRSLDKGLSIMRIEGDQVVRISPDGQMTVVKEAPRPIKVTAGSKIQIR